MIDRSRTPIAVTAIRIGRTHLGDGTLVIDDDAVTIVVRSTVDERPVRVPLASVDGVVLGEGDDHELSLSLRDSTRVTLVLASAGDVRDELLLRCRALPELTRALRAFGSRRGHRSKRASASADQQRFFAPLLAARRSAGAAIAPTAVVGAFSAGPLSQALEGALREFAVERHGENGPARRALEAELGELIEPLLRTIHALGDASLRALETPDDLRLWRAWAAQLRVTFEAADRAWLALDVALDAAPSRK